METKDELGVDSARQAQRRMLDALDRDIKDAREHLSLKLGKSSDEEERDACKRLADLHESRMWIRANLGRS